MVLILLLVWSVTSLARGTMQVVDRLLPRPDATLVEVPVSARR
ncbi:hypothetical protein PO878_00655 [Iamia majanohamensis]|uniref:Uncharacterized protein n=1 Tax=Iamia majanohamensis TaxID=467976 RepID=A0AAE9Y7Q3_9ACTN|nr:hypothetical protein [Iamia majanohamensis]WCO67231.1 hypothetical protein PO878_00655 [Iamia majanohamensis]